MPELPEVETVRRGLAGVMSGRRIDRLELRRYDLRFPFPPDFHQRLQGARVERIDRRAKYLLSYTDRDDVLIMHLGMSGRFTIVPPNGQSQKAGVFYHAAAAGAGEGPHDHVIFGMDDGTRIVYADPRRFGIMDLAQRAQLAEHKLLRRIGAEPLDDGFDAAYLASRFAGRQAPIKAALLDQRIVAGLGNIYVCEALFRANLSPERKVGSLSRQDLNRLVRGIKAVLSDAITAGGSSLRDYAQADGELGYFQHTFAVYDREGQPCRRPGCAGTIARIVQSGRSTFYCRTCQC